MNEAMPPPPTVPKHASDAAVAPTTDGFQAPAPINNGLQVPARNDDGFKEPAPPGPKTKPATAVEEGGEKDSKEMKVAVAAAAAAAAARVAPAQREKAIQEATAAAIAEYRREKASSSSSQASPAPTPPASASYEAPDWGGAPEGVPYTLEILKNGQILEKREVSEKSFYTFGRAPNADVLLEHPSSSRLHAVLQFNAETKEPFIFDNSSTHGTFLNKKKVVPKVHVPLRVGDTLKFGQSTRIYLFGGPASLMPEEGPNREQRRQLQAMQYAKAMEEKEKKVAQAQMLKALGHSGGASWGMGDAGDMDDPNADLDDLDWRAFAGGNKLTEKQQKQAEKIRSREYKIANLRKETDRIHAKEKLEGGLTAGQASTMVRNEQAISKLEEEIEEIEEALNESVRGAILDRRKDKEVHAKKRKKQPDSDDEYLQGSDSEDEFFDRTSAAAGKGSVKGPIGTKKQKTAPVVESAATLYVKRETLAERHSSLAAAIAAEERKLAEASSSQPSDEAPGLEKHGSGAAGEGEGAGAGAGARAGQGAPGLEKEARVAAGAGAGEEASGLERKASGADGAGGGKGAADTLVDSLDAFMENMETNVEKDKLLALRKELIDVEAQQERTERLLKIADPDGWLHPGSQAVATARAHAAASAALQAKEAEKAKKAAAVAAAKKKAEKDIASFCEEFEEEEQEGGNAQVLAGHSAAAAATQEALQEADAPKQHLSERASVGLIKIQRPGGQAPKQQVIKKHATNEAAAAAAAQLIKDLSGPEQPKQGRAGSKRQPASASRAAPSKAVEDAASAKVSADIARLLAASHSQVDSEDVCMRDPSSGADADEWAPPTNQKGDGRTSLNDKLGY